MNRPYFEIANPEIPNILQGLSRGLSVLDVGCGSGVHGAELKRVHGHRVVGVDLSAESVAKANTRLEEAYVADVTKPELYPFFGVQKFDLILFSDILEHLNDPSDVLVRHFQLLAPGGQVLISLPNVAIWNVRLSILAGRFEYQDTGTLDRTHVRFFTRGTFNRFAQEAGLEVRKRRITPGILRPFVPWIKKVYGQAGAVDGQTDSSSIMDSGPYQFYLKWFYPIERAICGAWPSLLAFQFVILADPAVSIAHQLQALQTSMGEPAEVTLERSKA
ncbi:MAG: class I SAM-dependent methyltransferase [Acidobacteriota bacterium]|nr:class I SAM-dependent methyltransferase [Acidobacteriota bacterium]